MVCINETICEKPVPAELRKVADSVMASYFRLDKFLKIKAPSVMVNEEVEILKRRLDELAQLYENAVKE